MSEITRFLRTPRYRRADIAVMAVIFCLGFVAGVALAAGFL